ncbi:hypothetical protein N7532_010604 [Penicillium argentinense]|uniref:Ankyrin repeat protein n=1 Tax=Penicillium argentinense TaxID=1131581 RepID=A0A9W9EPX3_9EURO|nr:uncharacterized protein N7532_010604 [Penicillium argentinense]KAJ5085833.1 hypothetical protein N7532_010604 [Penicillium argentinense]
MSDVEAVSLPAALDVDVGQNVLATVKPDAPGSSSPRKSEAAPTSPSRRPSPGSQPVESDEEGPPSPKADSEAETIIQSGRESLSPEKKRKHIRHDPIRQAVDGIDGSLRKKPRIDADRGDRPSRGPRSSRFPSPSQRAGSPSSVVKLEKSDDSQSVTHDVLNQSSANDADRPRPYRKRSFSDSVDEKRECRRDSHTNSTIRDLKNNNAHFSRPSSTARSVSPTRSSHQRSVSGSHLPSKKKAPIPLTGFQRQGSEDRQSTSSSASGSPMPSAHFRKLGSGAGASASPAKQMGPKKLRDKSGRTPLARACADRKYDQVVQRHGERPEDLNVPDNAGNTPLQIASLNGEAPIVKFLLGAGCEINTKNIDKDTPLIDAVENGNVEVVKLLLDAGANPRTVNASGDEPYELVPQDLEKDEYEEIRKALADAKASSRPGRRSEEQIGPDTKVSSRRASVASPSRSPPPLGGAASNRRKTGRSEATRNDLLWTQATSENLRDFAAKGDEVGVVSILNILQKADNASLIAAAKGGHHDVLSLMYAMGDADADPNPLRGQKPGYNTPMLAAIGRGNTAVIELILSQPGFNPTRRLFEDRTYYELSRSRQGENWEEEYNILKSAYEKFGGSDKGRKDLSSPRRARGKEREDKRPARKESSSPVSRPKKLNESPNSSRPRSAKEVQLLKEKRMEKEKARTMGRPKSSARDGGDARASSDHDSNRPDSAKPKTGLSARRDSESSGVARMDEVKKRRLIAGRRPQERDRRPSLFSSDSLSGREEPPKSRHDNASDANTSLKRIRADDASPERSRSRGGDSDHLSPERKMKRPRVTEDNVKAMPNGAPKKSSVANESEKTQARRPLEDTPRDNAAPRKPSHPPKKPESSHHASENASADKNDEVKKEPQEPNTSSVAQVPADDKREEREAEKRREADREAEAKKAEAKKAEAKKAEAKQAEAKQAEAKQAEAKQAEAKQAEAKQAEAKQAEAKQAEAKQAEAKKAEEERIAEEKRREAEAEAKAKAEAQAKADVEAARARAAKEEADRAAEAAQAAREKAEEDDRKRKEAEQRRAKQAEDERQKKMEYERARIMKMRREAEAQEQRRRDALPGRLRVSANYVGSNDSRARSHAWLKNFLPLVTATTRQLEPDCSPETADEKWIPNYLVAPLLATNDLQLSQYSSWEKRKATPTQRVNLWRCTRRMLVYTDDPKYHNASFAEIMQLDNETQPKYFDMEHVFWIRLSDFTDLVPHIPHIHGLELEFVSMHIDPEPSIAPSAAGGFQPNGHAPGAFATETNGSMGINGHGYPRPGTYF